eukprot:gene3079-3910_t
MEGREAEDAGSLAVLDTKPWDAPGAAHEARQERFVSEPVTHADGDLTRPHMGDWSIAGHKVTKSAGSKANVHKAEESSGDKGKVTAMNIMDILQQRSK